MNNNAKCSVISRSNIIAFSSHLFGLDQQIIAAFSAKNSVFTAVKKILRFISSQKSI